MSEHPRKRALIFTGGNLGRWALDHLSANDYLIGADSGAAFLIDNGYKPDLALGDFDSVHPEHMQRIESESSEWLAFDPIHKDWTDTELAFREAVRREFKDIVVLGALGTRFDHGLGNVHLHRQAHEQGCTLTLIDENNEIILCTDEVHLNANSRYPYTSLLPLTPEVIGVTLQGFRYPLNKATLKLGWSLGISNVLESEQGTVAVSSGMLLIIRSRD
jgi:thiamine pyrophosphokinase